jgi:hypothetical protein
MIGNARLKLRIEYSRMLHDGSAKRVFEVRKNSQKAMAAGLDGATISL